MRVARPPVVVSSFTDVETRYVVEYRGDRMVCNCPVPKATCKHRELVARADQILARCEQLHGTDGAICRDCFVAVMATAARKVVGREKALVKETKKLMREAAPARLRKEKR